MFGLDGDLHVPLMGNIGCIVRKNSQLEVRALHGLVLRV